jgi:predicted N-acyltransferase
MKELSESLLRIVEVDPSRDQRWETLLSRLPGGLIYHHPLWLEVLEEAYRYRPQHLACEDEHGDLLGILPLFHTQGLLSGHCFSSLPRTPVAGPLACDDRAMTHLASEAIERVRRRDGASLQLKLPDNCLDGRIAGLVGTSWRETYQMTLPERPELLRFGNSRNHAQIKRAVKKAEKQGIVVCQAETEAELRTWYDLYLDVMRRVVIPPRPLSFFQIAWKRLHPRGLLRLLLAKQYSAGQSRTIAGLLLLMAGETVFYAFSGWRREEQDLRPNDALHWHAIHDASAEGFRYYDFGEVPANNPGLAEFKSKWGTERKWLYRYYYPAPRESAITILDGRNPVYQLAQSAWQRLPLKATVVLGEVAHRLF